MLNFLHPTVLFALIAGAIPLIIHLLNRRKIKEIEFSTIHFLRQMARKEMRRLKIRQILLLIIRTLIVLLLVLAFARPALKQQGGLLAGKGGSEVVIAIDNSLSLARLELTGNLVERERQRFLSLEPAFNSDDRITVVSAVKPLKILAYRQPYSDALWKKIAKQIQPGYLPGDLTTATEKAIQIFDEADRYRNEFFILSDFQANGLDGTTIRPLLSSFKRPLASYLLPVNSPPAENISVDSVIILNRLLEKDQQLRIKAQVTNRHPEKYLTSLISLILNKTRVAQQNVSLAPAESKTVVFSVPMQQTGWVSGSVACQSDMLLEDNHWYFNFHIPDKIRVLHIIPDHRFRSYLPTILKPAIDKHVFAYQQAVLADWSGINLDDYRVVVAEGLDRLPEGLALRLRQFSQAGGGLWIIPGPNLVPSEVNSWLKALGMGQITGRAGKPGDRAQFVTLGRVNWDHPVFEGLFEKKPTLNPVQFYAYYKIRPSARSDISMRLSNQDPLLVSSNDSRANAFLLAAPLDPQWTDLLVHGFVVPLSYRILYYSVVRQSADRLSLPVGAEFLHKYRRLTPPLEFTLRTPDGLIRKISPVYQGSVLTLRIAGNQIPGNYRVLKGGKLMTLYSVNHPQQESVQTYLDQARVQAIFPGGKWLPQDDGMLAQIENSRFGVELWPYLLGLVLLLLLAEMALGYTASRRQANETRGELAGN